MTVAASAVPDVPETLERKQGPRLSRRRNRVRRTALIALAALAVVLFAALVNAVMNRVERWTMPAYGERIAVTGGDVNVYRHGDTGPVIVMLSGYDTAAPAVDFAPLIRQLDDYQVVVVEGFGYGYSDTTAPPRTVENITSELHEAVTALHLDGPYVLLGHSIAGVYDLYYANRYRDEVAAVIGIDASVPGQVNGLAGQSSPWNQLLATSGVLRALSAIAPALVEPDSTAYTPEERERMRVMTNWNWANPALRNEAVQSDHNFSAVQDMTYPSDLPVLSFIKTHDNPPRWRTLHERQLTGREHGELVELDGDHYLHWSQAPTMAQDIRTFLAAAGVTR